ncbi:MAG TPA: hypothetical protein VHZ02_14505 [Acidimicrobiales bacterium]|nr:hypothetical protein [Acidimicrobiales bacterium]
MGGELGKLTAAKPRSAFRRISAAASSTSGSHGSCRGMIRSGKVPAHTSRCQSFQALMQAKPSSPSFEREKTAPQNPATREGKHSEAQMPALSMSAIRAPMS